MSAPHLGIDAEDFELNILPQLEKTFQVKFNPTEIANFRTFGDLCEAILAKLPPATSPTCTTQQAFYKLRQALAPHTATQPIGPATALATLLPTARQRRRAVAAVANELGIKLNLLRMPRVVAAIGSALLVGSVACLFFDHYRQLGMEVIALTVIGLDIASRAGTSLRFATMRDLTENIVDYHYQAVRRYPATVNRAEIIPRLRHIFNQSEGIDLSDLTPEAIL